MGRQSGRLYYRGNNHKDIYFQGNYHDAMYAGNDLVWKKLNGGHPDYSFYYILNPAVIQDLGGGIPPTIIDEYGFHIKVNADAIIQKAAICIKWEHVDVKGIYPTYCTMACVGTGIRSAICGAYFGYKGLIQWDFEENDIPLMGFHLDPHGNVWRFDWFDEEYASIWYYYYSDIHDKGLINYAFSEGSNNMRVFDDLLEMKAWLLS